MDNSMSSVIEIVVTDLKITSIRLSFIVLSFVMWRPQFLILTSKFEIVSEYYVTMKLV